MDICIQVIYSQGKSVSERWELRWEGEGARMQFGVKSGLSLQRGRGGAHSNFGLNRWSMVILQRISCSGSWALAPPREKKVSGDLDQAPTASTATPCVSFFLRLGS